MNLVAWIRSALEWLTLACFWLWCLFSYTALFGWPRMPITPRSLDAGFAVWFVAAWWGWSALIRAELAPPATGRVPLWVPAGLVAGLSCVGLALGVAIDDWTPAASVTAGDAAWAILALMLGGLAPALLAVDDLRRLLRRP